MPSTELRNLRPTRLSLKRLLQCLEIGQLNTRSLIERLGWVTEYSDGMPECSRTWVKTRHWQTVLTPALTWGSYKNENFRFFKRPTVNTRIFSPVAEWSEQHPSRILSARLRIRRSQCQRFELLEKVYFVRATYT